jgi:hypothetical protein
MREKTGLVEKLDGLGHGRDNRLQPLRRFVLSLREATELHERGQMRKKRDFLKTLSSNPSLKAKTLSWHWDTLWDGVAHAKADFALHEHFLSSSSSPLGESQEDNVAHGGPVWAYRATPVAALGGLAPELVSIGEPNRDATQGYIAL